MTYPVYISEQAFERSMDLLLINDENKHHYVYNKDFNRFIFNKTSNNNINNNNNNKKHFCKYCLQCFSSERGLIEHKETCLEINDKLSVKLRSGSIKFQNYFKQ